MIETEGRVSRTEPGFAWVDVTPVSACGGCGQKSSCGTSALAQVFGKRRSDLRVIDESGVSEGDWVKVGLHEMAMFRTALFVYGLPLCGFVFGAIITSLMIEGSDLASALGGLIGLGLGWAIARRRSDYLASDHRYHPRIINAETKTVNFIKNN